MPPAADSPAGASEAGGGEAAAAAAAPVKVYVAQHALFEQVPSLRRDIMVRPLLLLRQPRVMAAPPHRAAVQ